MESKMNSTYRVNAVLFVTFFVLIFGLLTFIEVNAASERPILVGTSVSLSGPFSRNGEDQLKGWQVWKDDVNKRGGLLGRRVELVHYDDRSEPSIGVKLYEKLITDDKVDLLGGPYGSSTTMAVTTVAEKYKMVMVCTGASSMAIFERGYKYSFQMMTPSRYEIKPVVVMAKEKGYKTVAIVAADTAYSRDLAAGGLKDAKELGLQVVLNEEYPLKAMDLSSLVGKIKSTNPDVLIAASYVPDSILLTKQAKEIGLVPKVFAFGPTGPAMPDFTKSLGKDADYILGVSQWVPTAKYPGVQEFVRAFKERFNEEVTYNSTVAYGAGQLLEEAVKRVGSLNQDRLRDVLAQLNTITVFGPFKVDEGGAQLSHQSVIIQIIKGNRVVVWPDEAKEANIILPFPGWK